MNDSRPAAQRQSNIELLRIIAAIGVIMLHYNNASIGGGSAEVAKGSKSAFVLCFSEALFICSVDLFMMILGFFQANKEHASLSRPVLLLLQVSVVRFVYYLVHTLCLGESLTAGPLLRSLLPSNHFIMIYCTVYVLSPYLNRLLGSLGKTGRRNLLLLLIMLFSVFPTGCDLLKLLWKIDIGPLSTISDVGSGHGYTLVNYMMMYCIGAVICLDIKLPVKNSIIGFLACLIPNLLAIWITQIRGAGFSDVIAYSQPLVIGCAFFALQLFLSLDLGVIRWINLLARGTFMIYLTHKYLFPHLMIPAYTAKGGFSMLIHICVVIVLCSAAGFLLQLLYDFVMSPLKKAVTSKLNGIVIRA